MGYCRSMKVKKIAKGYYQITIDNDVYTVEQNFDLFDNGWQIEINNEIIDVATTLSEAKQVIKEINERIT
jgi:hypothetical protein